MKKFKFRLERVLKYREAVKEDKRRKLAKKNTELTEKETKLSALEEAFLNNQVTSEQISNLDMLRLAQFYAVRLKSEIAKQKVLIRKVSEEVEEAKVEYIEAAKEAKTLETLKQKKQEEYKAYIAKEDEKFLDEMTTQKGNRMGF